MNKKQETIRFQRLPGRGEMFDLFRQVRAKVRRERAFGISRTR